MPRPLRVLMVSAEVESLARTGGLGDVAEALPRALATLGADVVVATPLYGVTRVPPTARRWTETLEARVGWGPADVHRFGVLEVDGAVPATAGRLRFCLIDEPSLFARNGIYGDASGLFADNLRRFAMLSRGALSVAEHVWGAVDTPGGGPDVVHAHDWHAALAVLYTKLVMGGAWRARPSVFTIHNLGYQGTGGFAEVDLLGIPREAWTQGWVKHEEQLNLMKGAIELADRVTTVSATYAREILAPAAGFGLDAHLRWHASKLVGIVNGIDTASFDPAVDPAIPQRYDPRTVMAGKLACRRALAREVGLDDGAPMFAAVSRMTPQKGLDLVASVAPGLVARGASLLLVGQGDADLEQATQALAARYPRRIASKITFDAGLARRVFAGADFVLVPSRYEPCGLTQMYAMRYGAIPIVTPVGGLRDTVAPWDPPLGAGTGFVAEGATPHALWLACDEAIRVRADPSSWSTLVSHAMARDSGWKRSAERYVALYEELSPPRSRTMK
jgi:starch synthase